MKPIEHLRDKIVYDVGTYDEALEWVSQIEKDEKNLELITRYLKKWYKQLAIDGCNSKSMVRNDIQYLLKVIENKKQ